MRQRRIIGVERGERSTTLRLECGHDRSIGGHIMADGSGCPQPGSLKAGATYNCHDGHCGGWGA